MKVYKFYAVAVSLAMMLAACEKDDFTGHSRQTPTSPTISVDASAVPSTVNEGDEEEFDIIVTMDEAQIVDVAVHISQIGGDAVAHDDYDVTETVIIPAGETEGTATLTIVTDCAIEGSKTLTLQVGDDRTANADITPVEVDVTIDNAVAPELEVIMTWTNENEDVVNGLFNGKTAYQMADIDLYIYDVANDAIVDASFTLGSEHVTFPAGLADGEYWLFTEYWELLLDPGPDWEVEWPLALNFEKCGAIEPFDLSTGWSYFSTDAVQTDYPVIAYVIVTGGVYDIYDADDVLIGSGRTKGFMTAEKLAAYRTK